MIRAGADADAAHVSLLVDPDRGVTMYRRSDRGGPTEGRCVGVMTEDVVLRLDKTGDDVRCLYRQAGAAGWYELGNATAALGGNGNGGTFLVGQAMASGELGAHAQLTTGDLDIVPIE